MTKFTPATKCSPNCYCVTFTRNELVCYYFLIELQIDLPDLIIGRCDHSVSTVTLNNNTVWIIVTGGRENVNYKVFYDAEVAMVVELG